MQDQVIAKLQEIVRARGWSALLLLTPENVTYAIGFVIPSHPLMRWRHAACIVPAEGRPSLFVVDMEASTIRNLLPDTQLFVWGEFTESAMEVLAGALGSLGLDRGALGIELDFIPAGDFAALQRHLPNVRWEACGRDVTEARMIKTPSELATLRALSHLTDATIHDAMTSSRAGETEMDVAGRLMSGLMQRGADRMGIMIVASGERSVYPNVGPTTRVLQRGDLVRTEIFGVLRGYQSGVCRTSIVGEPDDEMKRVWSVMVETRHLVFDRIGPGVSAAAVYREVLDRFTSAGLNPLSFVGHGIGVHLHEEPYLGRYTDDGVLLRDGMVLGVEPVYLGPRWGMQIKDIVAVTGNGCEVLSNASDGDELIRIPA